jgi:hypothetical protein
MLHGRGFLVGRSRRDCRVRHPCLPAVSPKPPEQAGGLPEISRWLREAWRAPPPVMNKKQMHPGGMPETHVARFWHPSGRRFSYKPISGGDARQASLWPCPPAKAGTRSWPALRAIACGDAISALPRSVNHRLISFKPPACPGGPAETALPKTGLRVTSDT